jgi:hypothetical protein
MDTIIPSAGPSARINSTAFDGNPNAGIPVLIMKFVFAILSRISYRLLLLAITVTYIIARLALIFQEFVALRTLPPGALQDIEWTNHGGGQCLVILRANEN